nr:classical arabinogalactan protein 9-like [Aegilops tauschii subsp. strangulata]
MPRGRALPRPQPPLPVAPTPCPACRALARAPHYPASPTLLQLAGTAARLVSALSSLPWRRPPPPPLSGVVGAGGLATPVASAPPARRFGRPPSRATTPDARLRPAPDAR